MQTRKKLAIAAIVFMISGFGVIYGSSAIIQYISMAIMVLGVFSVVFLLLSANSNNNKEN